MSGDTVKLARFARFRRRGCVKRAKGYANAILGYAKPHNALLCIAPRSLFVPFSMVFAALVGYRFRLFPSSAHL